MLISTNESNFKWAAIQNKYFYRLAFWRYAESFNFKLFICQNHLLLPFLIFRMELPECGCQSDIIVPQSAAQNFSHLELKYHLLPLFTAERAM